MAFKSPAVAKSQTNTAKAKRNLSARRAKQKSARMIRTWLVVMSLFLSELLFYTWCRVQVTRTGYEISEEYKKQQRLLALQRNLNIELARLKSPQRIGSIARDQLHLAKPDPEQVIVIP